MKVKTHQEENRQYHSQHMSQSIWDYNILVFIYKMAALVLAQSHITFPYQRA